jgi:hypothetical protein
MPSEQTVMTIDASSQPTVRDLLEKWRAFITPEAEIDYYVTRKGGAKVYVWNDNDIEFFKSFQIGDAITFKERDNQQYLINELPEKLVVKSITHDESSNLYEVMLDHVLDWECVSDQDDTKSLTLTWTFEQPRAQYERDKKFFEDWKRLVCAATIPADIVMSPCLQETVIPQSVEVTFSYDHLKGNTDVT